MSAGRNWMDVVSVKRTYTRHRYNPDDPEIFYPKSPSTTFVNVMVRYVRSAFHDKSQLPMLKHLNQPGRETVFAYLGCLVYYWKQLTPIIAPKMGDEHNLWSRAQFAERAGMSCPRAKFADKELEVAGLLSLYRQGGQKPAIRQLMVTLVSEFSYEISQALPDFPSKTKNEKGIIAWIQSMLRPEAEARAVGQERSRMLGEKKGPQTPEERAQSFALGIQYLGECFRILGVPRATGPPVDGALPSPA